MFHSVLSDAADVSAFGFLICIAVSLVLGAAHAVVMGVVTPSSRGFTISLALLPTTACTIIMMVNGNLGTGVAVAGAFSLVRFRSMPGTGLEITALFESMAIGLACGAGYPVFAALFTAIICCATWICCQYGFGAAKAKLPHKSLQITVPEDLEYYGMFDDILNRHTSFWSLERVKTSDLGSLIRLSYDVILKEPGQEKRMIDELRCRNGNLEIVCSTQRTQEMAL